MKRVNRSLILILMFMILATSALCAKTDVITLRLTATVPPRAEVAVVDGMLDVGMNMDGVDFQAFDMQGNWIPSTHLLGGEDPITLCFTAA